MDREQLDTLELKTLEGTRFSFIAGRNCDKIENGRGSYIVVFNEEEYKFRKNEIIVYGE